MLAPYPQQPLVRRSDRAAPLGAYVQVDTTYCMLHLLTESKARGAAVSALGRLMAGEPHGPFRNLVRRRGSSDQLLLRLHPLSPCFSLPRSPLMV